MGSKDRWVALWAQADSLFSRRGQTQEETRSLQHCLWWTDRRWQILILSELEVWVGPCMEISLSCNSTWLFWVLVDSFVPELAVVTDLLRLSVESQSRKVLLARGQLRLLVCQYLGYYFYFILFALKLRPWLRFSMSWSASWWWAVDLSVFGSFLVDFYESRSLSSCMGLRMMPRSLRLGEKSCCFWSSAKVFPGGALEYFRYVVLACLVAAYLSQSTKRVSILC